MQKVKKWYKEVYGGWEFAGVLTIIVVLIDLFIPSLLEKVLPIEVRLIIFVSATAFFI